MAILWTIVIGFVAGIIAKLLHPGPNEPKGFILTTILGIVGAFVATYLGQAVGWYHAGDGAGFIGGIVGAVSFSSSTALSWAGAALSGAGLDGLPHWLTCGHEGATPWPWLVK